MLPFGKNKLALALSAVLLFTTSPVMAASFNYGEALQKSIFFYDIQRLGKISQATGDLANRVYWRSDSFLQDYALPNSEGAIDLGGGFADAGDNVKFNLPMAASTTILAWSIIDFQTAFQNTNQLKPMLANLRWATDYLLKCWDGKNNRLYGQVSPDSVGAEHSALWMPYEVIDQASTDKSLPRYGFYVDTTHPGTDLAADTVSALTAASLAFQASDPTYANQLLSTAKTIYQKMVNVSSKGKYSDNMGRMSGGSWKKADVSAFYNSWSGYNDEIAFASMWLYRATNDPTYIPIAEQFITFGNTAATLSWDDKSYGAYLLMAKFLPSTDTNKAKALQSAQGWLDSWSKGLNGHSFSRDGLAIASALTPWGNARYAATTAFGALVYDLYFNATTYDAFAKNQIDYILGNNSKQFSYMCGFGSKYPKQPHHATAEGRWAGNNDVSYAGDNRHIDYGGLVGGPKDANDTYTDDRGDYIGNEVALDYNAGFVGALAGLVAEYGGTPLPANQFPPTAATENPPADQFFVNGAIQSAQMGSQQSVIQVSLLATNHSAWPARVTNNLKVRYFMTLADKPASGTVTVKTFSTDSRAVISPLTLFDASKKIYYVDVWFKNIPIYPGGDDRSISSKETQIQFTFNWAHDYTKDWSYTGLGAQGTYKEAPNVAIYEVTNSGDKLLFGKEPSSVPQGNLTVNFAANIPSQCVGAKDSLTLSTGDAPSFTASTSPFIYTMAAGGPYTVKINSATIPVTVTGGTCKGSLNASQVSVPGSLTANYVFTPTPLPTTGTLQVVASSNSDARCSAAVDTLYLDGSSTGTTFTVKNGISSTVNTGMHTLKLASQTSIPVNSTVSGYCSSILDTSQLTISKDQTSTATATYTYKAAPSMSCTITSAKVTQQSTWGTLVVNTFAFSVNLQGFPTDSSGAISMTGTFTMKNNFVQNFWSNFGMTTSSFSGSVGKFTGSVWPTQLPISFGGFITNTIPMAVGDNPLVSMTINGVVCQ
ncbi:MAG: glycoside hydrolase family 9 protein [Gammaproteobacteria bacterium]|nr:glycoside hydrolase family 9 protein [Gammaproteobacteria bacterium]